MKESEILAEVLVDLSRRGFLVWRNNSGALYETFPAGMFGGRQLFGRGRLVRFGLEGSPDIVGLCRGCGLFVGVEVKRPRGGRVSDLQKAFGAHLRRAGALYGVVWSADEVEALVAEHRCPSVAEHCEVCGDVGCGSCGR